MRYQQYLSIAILLIIIGIAILLPNAPPLPGDRTTGRMILDQGVKHEDMPLWGLGVKPASLPNTSLLEVRLASAVQLSTAKGRWAALKQLAKEFPNSLAVHSTLARYACNSQGGAIRVGRSLEIGRLNPTPAPPAGIPMGGGAPMMGPSSRLIPASIKPPVIEPSDVQILLTSCALGERIEPENGYFPALAAVAYAAIHRNAEAMAALHRAGQKRTWNEHLEFEAQGREQRARLLKATGGSTGEILRITQMTFAHESQLNELARLAVVWAMKYEQRGDIAQGLTLRRDVARLGRLLQTESAWNVSSVLGTVIEDHAASRPGGAPALSGKGALKRAQARFVAYLRQHGESGEANAWEREFQRRVELRSRGKSLMNLPLPEAAIETQVRALTSLVISAAVVLVVLIAGLAYALNKSGKRSAFVGIPVFLLLLSGQVWLTLGTATDQLGALGMFLQMREGCGCGSPEETFEKEREEAVIYRNTPFDLSPQLFAREYGLMGLMPGILILWAFLILVLGNRPGKPSRSRVLRSTALPLAAMLGLLYSAHSALFRQREHTLQRELAQLRQNESAHPATIMLSAR